MLKEKEKQIEQLKKDMSKLVPPEMLESIRNYKWVIRERDKTIKALTAELNMFRTKHDEYKSERETLVNRVAAFKKSYLEENMQHSELYELLATNTDSIPLPQSSHVL